MTYSKIAIIGPGLLGGSLALAVRERKLAAEISICGRSEKSLEPVRKSGLTRWIFTDPARAVEDAELVVLCTPIGAMKTVAEAMRPGLDPFAVVTDVGSVKAPLVAELEPILDGAARWIGSHPMAGSERSGFKAARADLFSGTVAIVTPTESTDPAAVEAATNLWQRLGSKVVRLDPLRHDELAAQISHLPQLAASALAGTVSADSLQLAGPGFRDTTRIAASNPDIWTEILLANRPALAPPLDALIEKLTEVRRLLESGNEKGLHEFLARANHVRSQLKNESNA